MIQNASDFGKILPHSMHMRKNMVRYKRYLDAI